MKRPPVALMILSGVLFAQGGAMLAVSLNSLTGTETDWRIFVEGTGGLWVNSAFHMAREVSDGPSRSPVGPASAAVFAMYGAAILMVAVGVMRIWRWAWGTLLFFVVLNVVSQVFSLLPMAFFSLSFGGTLDESFHLWMLALAAGKFLLYGLALAVLLCPQVRELYAPGPLAVAPSPR